MNHVIDALKPSAPFGGPANTDSALNIRIVLRSSAANCFFFEMVCVPAWPSLILLS